MEFNKINLDEFEDYFKAYTEVHSALCFAKYFFENPDHDSLRKEAIEKCSKAIKGLDEVKTFASYERSVDTCMKAMADLEKAFVKRGN